MCLPRYPEVVYDINQGAASVILWMQLSSDGWEIFPIKRESDMHRTLDTFLVRNGIPEALTSIWAKAYTVDRFCQKEVTWDATVNCKTRTVPGRILQKENFESSDNKQDNRRTGYLTWDACDISLICESEYYSCVCYNEYIVQFLMLKLLSKGL
jgi:hypothetical protein